MPTTSAQMALTIPVAGDASPAQVAAVAASLAALDAHNHAPGAGGRVPTAGLNVNAALPFNGASAQALRSCLFQNLGAPLASANDNGALFVSGGELYFLDGSNRAVRFTKNGTIGTGGSFGGDYITYGAVANYGHSSKQYGFFDEFNVRARLQAGQILAAGAGGFGNTAPAIGADGVSLLPANTAAASTMLSCKGDVAAQGGFTHTAFANYLALSQSMGGASMRGPGGSFGSATWTAPRSGSVVGISYFYSNTQTAGTLSFRLLQNTNTVLANSASFTGGRSGSTTFAKDAKPFAAGDRIDVVVFTDGSFSPPFNHVVAYVHVEY